MKSRSPYQRGNILKMCTALRRELNFEGFRGFKIEKKTIKNLLKIYQKSMPKSIKFSMLFWIDFLMDFGSQNPPKSIPRHLENWALATAPCKFCRYCLLAMVIDFSSILGSIFDWFLEDFGSQNRSKNRSQRALEIWWILASIFGGFWTILGAKMEAPRRTKSEPKLWFGGLGALLGPRWPQDPSRRPPGWIFDGFWIKFWWFLDDFWMNFGWFFNDFGLVSHSVTQSLGLSLGLD